MLNKNRAIAEENIAQEPKIIELKSTVNELAEEGKTMVAELQDKINDYKSKSGNLSYDTALALLQSAAVEAEDESEKIYQQFLDKDIENIDIFIEQFIESRKKMHERKLKADKLIELGRNQNNRSGVINNFYPSPMSGGMGLPYPMGQPSGGVPYPMGPTMPMPGSYYRPQF